MEGQNLVSVLQVPFRLQSTQNAYQTQATLLALWFQPILQNPQDLSSLSSYFLPCQTPFLLLSQLETTTFVKKNNINFSSVLNDHQNKKNKEFDHLVCVILFFVFVVFVFQGSKEEEREREGE